MTEEIRRLPVGAVEADPSLRRLIGRVCGHYLYHEPQLREARGRLGANVDLHRLLAEGAEGHVKARVKNAIAF